jgi:ATP-dependent HslUV protease ATP-binding subunit HslU
VELDNLTTDDFVRILKEPENALIKQYIELVKTEGVKLIFKHEAIREIAETASFVNNKAENIGARRLHTIMSKLLEDILFDSPDCGEKEVVIDRKFVKNILKNIIEDEDLRKFIL